VTGKHPPPVGGRTLADDVRDDLTQCENWVGQVGMGGRSARVGFDGLALLHLLDRVADELERLETRGVDLRAERGRWETMLAQLRRRAKTLVAQVDPTLATQRPPGARWWWYLDEQVTADRRRRLRQTLVGVLVGLGVLALAYFFYENFVAPPPHIRQATAQFYDGERAVTKGDWARAIEHFESAVAFDPEYAEAHLWLGVLYQETDAADRAAVAFEQAQRHFDTESYFLFQRALFYLASGDTGAASGDAQRAIEAFPDRPEGYYVQGHVAEELGDLELAVASFRRVIELAEASGAVELEVNARLRLATLTEALLMPQP
jgi:tetratricopeptide (TPR) repeat protein